MSEPRPDRRSNHETPESQAAEPHPAGLALFILQRVCSPEVRDEAEGDLMEAFNRWEEAQGPRFARMRVWREVALLAACRVVGARRRSSEETGASEKGQGVQR